MNHLFLLTLLQAPLLLRGLPLREQRPHHTGKGGGLDLHRNHQAHAGHHGRKPSRTWKVLPEDLCTRKKRTDKRIKIHRLLDDATADRQTMRVENLHEQLEGRHRTQQLFRVEQPELPPPLPPGAKYLMVISAFEQFGGARVVIADAVAIAKTLGWTFVEPVLLHGRVVNPFETTGWVPLGMMLDIKAMRQYYPNWIGVNDFLNMTNAGNRSGPGVSPLMHIVERRAQPDDSTLAALKESDLQIVAMGRFMRKGSQFISNASVDGVPIKPAWHVRRLAETVLHDVGTHGYMCAQWRTEGVNMALSDTHGCARALEQTVLEARACNLWGGKKPKVLLLSDVRSDTSDTMHQRSERLAVEKYLEQSLKHRAMSTALERIEDHGLRGLVEQYLCASTPVMVACPYNEPGARCAQCARTQSKFANFILSLREEMHMPPAISW